MATYTLRVGCYPSRSGFRPVVRLSCGNRMEGSKPSPHLFDTADAALMFARTRAAEVLATLQHDVPDCEWRLA